MGNNLNDTGKDSLLTLIKEQYEEVKQDPRGMVLLHKQSQNNFILKQYTYCSQLQFQNKVNQLQEQIKRGTRQYVISPTRMESKVFSSFCSNSYKIYVIFEYPQVSLREEITARQKQNKNFEETELWSILQSCTNALSELKPLISLNPNEIFINPDGHLKIIHDDLVDQNYRAVLNDQVYYAPQKIKSFNKVDSQLSLRKQSIFSMGMTLLQAALLAPVGSCYDYINCSFFQVNMVEMLDSLSQKYSPEFIELLGNIIETNPNRRASLMEVQKLLDNYWGAEQSHYLEQTQKQTQNRLSETSRKSKKQEIPTPSPLLQKCFNTSKLADIQKEPFIKSARKSSKHKQKQKQITIPDQMSSYKLEKPKPQEDIPAITTPKNQQPSLKEGNLYTDPKLLEMIKKDLEDISKLKQSAFYQTSKYTYMYPQTQSILNSIKNFQSQPKIPTNQTIVGSFSSVQPNQPTKTQQNRSSLPKRSDIVPNKAMMKKNNNELIFSVQTYQNGRRYEGTTLYGKKHGRGKLMFEDGAYYQGEFKQDKMNGKGILYYSQNFPAYDGEWENDQFQGYGILYNEGPQSLQGQFDFRDMNEVEDYWIKYQGQFNMDNKSGKGTLYLTNGQTLEGEFSEDCVNGIGRYKFVNGQVFDGIWNQNVLTQIIQTQ